MFTYSTQGAGWRVRAFQKNRIMAIPDGPPRRS